MCETWRISPAGRARSLISHRLARSFDNGPIDRQTDQLSHPNAAAPRGCIPEAMFSTESMLIERSTLAKVCKTRANEWHPENSQRAEYPLSDIDATDCVLITPANVAPEASHTASRGP